jgi:hypothetical protein
VSASSLMPDIGIRLKRVSRSAIFRDPEPGAGRRSGAMRWVQARLIG